MKREIPKRLTEYVDGEARMVNSQAFGHKEIYKKLAAYEDVFPNPADVAPVVHGYWKFKTRRCDAWNVFECSACHNEWETTDDYETPGYDYCPDCGAKMDESEDNNNAPD